MKAIRDRVVEAVYSGRPVAARQRAVWLESDHGGWVPSEYDSDYGEYVKAEAEVARLWASAAEAAVDGEAYAAVVGKHGRGKVVEVVRGWYADADEAMRRLDEWAAAGAAYEVDQRDGKAGSLADLSNRYPEHVRSEEWYSENGDGGWAGGGPDSWGAGADYYGKSEAGKAAIEAVKAGARPRQAMEAAIEAVKVRLEAEGKAKAEAEAVARGDREAARKLEEAGQAAIWKMADVCRRSMPDGSGMSPWRRRSSELKAAQAAGAVEVRGRVASIECPDGLSREVQREWLAKLGEYVGKREAEAERARRWEGIAAKGDGASREEAEALIASGWLVPREKDEWKARLEEREEKRASVGSLSGSAWGALDGLKK